MMTDIGRALSYVRMSANRNSFHEKAKLMIAAAAIAGAAKGKAIRQKALKCEQPSTSADSSSSIGSSLNASRIISTANGIVNVALAMMSAIGLSNRRKNFITRKKGMTVTIGGRKRCERNHSVISLFCQRWNRKRANP